MKLLALENDEEYIQLQTEMIALQDHIEHYNQRLLIIFEGRDSAGKGGAIMRFVRYLNPRQYQIVALAKPTEIERGQWYFQRYIKRLPDPGMIALFDRSWYNRAVVEPVMGFCSEDQYHKFMNDVVDIERILITDSLKIIKFWFSIDIDVQKERLKERHENPLLRWKLSTVDAVAQQKWNDYTHYKSIMFEKTSTEISPWVVINGNDKTRARYEAMRYVINQFDYERKGETGVNLENDSTILKLYRTSLA